MSDTKERVIKIIAGTLRLDGADLANLRRETGYAPLPQWDSMRHVEIIVALEDEFGLEIEERMISRLNDVAKIVAYLEGASNFRNP